MRLYGFTSFVRLALRDRSTYVRLCGYNCEAWAIRRGHGPGVLGVSSSALILLPDAATGWNHPFRASIFHPFPPTLTPPHPLLPALPFFLPLPPLSGNRQITFEEAVGAVETPVFLPQALGFCCGHAPTLPTCVPCPLPLSSRGGLKLKKHWENVFFSATVWQLQLPVLLPLLRQGARHRLNESINAGVVPQNLGFTCCSSSA